MEAKPVVPGPAFLPGARSARQSFARCGSPPSPLLVALMQTATSLPVFLVGLPAGTLADVVDRRKLLLVTQAWMLLVALVLGVITWLGLVSAWALLALTFLLGLGAALSGPAWQAIIP